MSKPHHQEFELVITRLFDASRERVFKAWTSTEDVLQWSGPRDWPVVETEADVRVGGEWRSVLQNPETGEKLFQGGVYQEIKEPELLVFTFAWGEKGCVPGLKTVVTIRFEDVDGKTRMHFHQAPFPTQENRDGHNGGWSSSFDRLEELLRHK
ncbi:MAG: SRPBCC domain-containing protein [Hyphomicrobiales bacterium]|nr:SRPBCC domain-containing protein [Hyphomicrobiales bacterium]